MPDADIILTADQDNDGGGGVQVSATGKIDSGRDVIITGSDLSTTMGVLDSIVIEAFPLESLRPRFKRAMMQSSYALSS